MMEERWDVRRGAIYYRHVSGGRLRQWIKTGKIKAGETVVWREDLSGWRKPEELEELRQLFDFSEIARTGQGEIRKSKRRPSPGKKRIKSILLVDDEKELCFLLGAALSTRGFQVEFAHTKRNALQRLRGRRTDLVVLDLGLPDGDGMTLLSAIGKLTPSPAVIIATAFGSEEARSRAKRSGVHGFIDKPYNEEDIIRRIREMRITRATPGVSEVKTAG
jgi:CheY-like chemotaxis protein